MVVLREIAIVIVMGVAYRAIKVKIPIFINGYKVIFILKMVAFKPYGCPRKWLKREEEKKNVVV